MSAVPQRRPDEAAGPATGPEELAVGADGAEALPDFIEEGRKLLYRREHAQAIRILRAGLAARADDEGSLLLAKALVLSSRFREARTVLELLVAGEGDAAAHALLVRVCLALQDVSAAVRHARRGILSFPDHPDLQELSLQAEADYEMVTLEGDAAEQPTERDVMTAERAAWLFGDEPQDDEGSPRLAGDDTTIAPQVFDEEDTAFDEAITAPLTPPPVATPVFGPLLGPGAPSLEAAVQRFIRAANPAAPGGGLFSSLVGDGPPLAAKVPEPESSSTLAEGADQADEDESGPVAVVEDDLPPQSAVSFDSGDEGALGDAPTDGGWLANLRSGPEPVSSREQEERQTPFVPPKEELLSALESSGSREVAPEPAPVAPEDATRATLSYGERPGAPAQKSARRSREVELEEGEAPTRATLRVGETADPRPSESDGLDDESLDLVTPVLEARDLPAVPQTGPQPKPADATAAEFGASEVGPGQTGPRQPLYRSEAALEDEDDEELSFRRQGAQPTPATVGDAAGELTYGAQLPPVDEQVGLDEPAPSGEDFLGSVHRLRRERPTLDLGQGVPEGNAQSRVESGSIEVATPAPDRDRARFIAELGDISDPSIDTIDPHGGEQAPEFERRAPAAMDARETPTLELRRRQAPTPSEIALPPSWRGDGDGVDDDSEVSTADFGRSARAHREDLARHPESLVTLPKGVVPTPPSFDLPAPLPGAAERPRANASVRGGAEGRSKADCLLRFERDDEPSLVDRMRSAPTGDFPAQGCGDPTPGPAALAAAGMLGQATAEFPPLEPEGAPTESAESARPERDLEVVAQVKISRPGEPTQDGVRLAEAPVAQRVIPEHEPAPRMRRRPSTAGTARRRTSWVRRRWPLALGLALALLAGGAVFGLYHHRHGQADTHLREARALARRDQAWTLRSSLEHARKAATLGGRSAPVVALAARIHARLAVEFGESSLAGVSSLIAESKRLGAPYHTRAGADLRVAEAYLQLAGPSLTQALENIARARKASPEERELSLLHAHALMRAGRYAEAGKLLQGLPAKTARVVRTRARLAWYQGQRKAARELLSKSASYGLSLQQMDLDLARFSVWDRSADDRVLHRLRALAGDKDLSRAERSWAHLLSSVIHRRQGRLSSCRRALRRSLEEQPVADADFHALAAAELLASNQHQKARDEAERARVLAPQHRGYRRTLARVELAMDRSLAAVRLLEGSRDSDDRLVLVAAYVRRRQLGRARTLWARLPSSPSLARQLVTARLLLAEGKPFQVLRELSGLPVKQRDHAAVEVLRARAALATGELEAAERFLRHALALQPEHAEALWAEGLLAERRSEARAARRAYAAAVKANGYRVRARLDFSRLLSRLGDYAAGHQQLTSVLALQEQNPVALAARARARVELQRKDARKDLAALRDLGLRDRAKLLEARQAMLAGHWLRASKLLASLPKAWLDSNPEARLWRAEVAARRGRRPQARVGYKALTAQALDTIPREVQAAAHLGLSRLAFEGSREVALREARGAAELLIAGTIFPRSLKVAARLQIARCHRANKRVGAAIAELQEALELEPRSFDANLELARVYLTLRKPLRALVFLAKARKLRPDDKLARRLLARACLRRTPLPPACK